MNILLMHWTTYKYVFMISSFWNHLVNKYIVLIHFTHRIRASIYCLYKINSLPYTLYSLNNLWVCFQDLYVFILGFIQTNLYEMNSLLLHIVYYTCTMRKSIYYLYQMDRLFPYFIFIHCTHWTKYLWVYFQNL